MSFANLYTDARALFAFLVIMSVLVAAHEYGHYLFARIFKMGIEDFSIGMGKLIKVWKRKTYRIPVPSTYVHDVNRISEGAAFEGGNRAVESVLVDTPAGRMLQETTDFSIRALPLGGFVRIKGMVPQEDGSETRIPGGFYSKPPLQRFLVLLAGPAASVICGLIVLSILYFFTGIEKKVDLPVLGGVSEGSVAMAANLQEGDRILDIDDQPVKSFYQDIFLPISRGYGKPLKIRFERGATDFATTVVPNKVDGGFLYRPDLSTEATSETHGVIGIGPKSEHVMPSFYEACLAAVERPIEAVQSMFDMVRHPSEAKNQAGGIISIV